MHRVTRTTTHPSGTVEKADHPYRGDPKDWMASVFSWENHVRGWDDVHYVRLRNTNPSRYGVDCLPES